MKDSVNSGRYFFKADLKQEKKYVLIADSGSFGNIYYDTADSTGFNFSLRKPDTFSTLTLTIQNCKTSSIIQLMTNQEKIVNETIIKSDGKVVFPMLDAGAYRLKVIYDLNGDGKWTTGDFTRGIQPEPVSYYPMEINLKTGWVLDLDQDWDIDKQLYKEEKLREKKAPSSTRSNVR
jgi:hypothetical protein